MAPETNGHVLFAEKVTKRYGRTVALSGVSVGVERDEAVAIMGPSGSGKSTLLHVLAGILIPDEGRVVLRLVSGNGARSCTEDITALPGEARSGLRLRHFGFVFQQGFLLPELTANENVILPLLLSGVARAEAGRRAEEVLRRFGIGDLGMRRIGQLSGGQAQRVAIARALVHKPQVLFADEPTGALDSRTADDVLEHLLAPAGRAGHAVILVTHDERVASRCDRTIRLRDGRIVEGAES